MENTHFIFSSVGIIILYTLLQSEGQNIFQTQISRIGTRRRHRGTTACKAPTICCVNACEENKCRCSERENIRLFACEDIILSRGLELVDFGIADRVEIVSYIHAVCSCRFTYLIDLRRRNTVVVLEEGFIRKSPVAEIDPIMVMHGEYFVLIAVVDS